MMLRHSLCLLAFAPCLAVADDRQLTVQQLDCHREQTICRQRAELPPQELDPYLCQKAQEWAEHMAARGELYHSPWEWRENIAYGPRTAGGVIRMWMDSSGHRRNLLSGVPCCGFGHAVSRGGTHYWCSLHGSRTGSGRPLFRRRHRP